MSYDEAREAKEAEDIIAELQDKNRRLRELLQRGIDLPPSEHDYKWRKDAKALLKI